MRNIVLAGLASLAMLAPRLVDAPYAQKGVGDTTGIASPGCQTRDRHPLGQDDRDPDRSLRILDRPIARRHPHHPGDLPRARSSTSTSGPASAVADMVAKLNVGDELAVKAFRTDKMKAGDYVAQSDHLRRRLVSKFRDASLRPVWAGHEPRPAHKRRPLSAAAVRLRHAAAARAWGGRGRHRPMVARGRRGSRRHGPWRGGR